MIELRRAMVSHSRYYGFFIIERREGAMGEEHSCCRHTQGRHKASKSATNSGGTKICYQCPQWRCWCTENAYSLCCGVDLDCSLFPLVPLPKLSLTLSLSRFCVCALETTYLCGANPLPHLLPREACDVCAPLHTGVNIKVCLCCGGFWTCVGMVEVRCESHIVPR